jgi:hypothetical protein
VTRSNNFEACLTSRPVARYIALSALRRRLKMSDTITDVWNSVFEPGVNDGLLRATNLTFYGPSHISQ